MDIKKAIDKFIQAKELDNCTDKGVKTYRERLGYFFDWLGKEYPKLQDVDDLRIHHLRDWLSFLQKTVSQRTGKPLSDRTIHSYGKALMVFCHWIEEEEIIEKQISRRFKLPKVEKKFVPTFTPTEVQLLLAACEESPLLDPRVRQALTERNKAIVSMLIDTGIRLKEIVGLRLCDVDRNAQTVLVHRKGDKWQQVPISEEGLRFIHVYITKYRSVLAKTEVARKHDPVFLTDQGEALSYGGVESLFKRIKTRTGITDKRVSPHNCRRYMATTQLKMGRSPLDVQRQMGHTTLDMTNHYASLTVEDLTDSHDMYSPLRAQENRGRKQSGAKYWNTDD